MRQICKPSLWQRCIVSYSSALSNISKSANLSSYGAEIHNNAQPRLRSFSVTACEHQEDSLASSLHQDTSSDPLKAALSRTPQPAKLQPPDWLKIRRRRTRAAFHEWDTTSGETEFCAAHLARRAHLLDKYPREWFSIRAGAPDKEAILAKRSVQQGFSPKASETDHERMARRVKSKRQQPTEQLHALGMDDGLALWYSATYRRQRRTDLRGVLARHWVIAYNFPNGAPYSKCVAPIRRPFDEDPAVIARLIQILLAFKEGKENDITKARTAPGDMVVRTPKSSEPAHG